MFINQIPRLAATYSMENKDELYFAAGPALQYIDEATKSAVFRVGGDAHMACTKHISKPWLFTVMTDYTQIASIYSGFR